MSNLTFKSLLQIRFFSKMYFFIELIKVNVILLSCAKAKLTCYLHTHA